MSEKTQYKTFRRNAIWPRDRCERVENLLVEGMPDVNVCIDGVESWIEFKNPKEPKRNGTMLFGSNHKVSQAQKNWHLKQEQAGGNSWFMVATDKRWMLIGGEFADDLNGWTVNDCMRHCAWWQLVNTNIPSWHELREVLGAK